MWPNWAMHRYIGNYLKPLGALIWPKLSDNTNWKGIKIICSKNCHDIFWRLSYCFWATFYSNLLVTLASTKNVFYCKIILKYSFCVNVEEEISMYSWSLVWLDLISKQDNMFLMGHPRPLFHLFSSFKQTLQFLQQINVEKCSSSIGCWDSNPQSLEDESPPITTRLGLPPNKIICCYLYVVKVLNPSWRSAIQWSPVLWWEWTWDKPYMMNLLHRQLSIPGRCRTQTSAQSEGPSETNLW